MRMNKEAIITIVGFLGAGKTTLLKILSEVYTKKGLSPFVILNDYEDAYIDAHQLTNQIDPKFIKALSGSCICCSGIHELRDSINQIPKRNNGVTLIEANGTTDAVSLAGFLGVGLENRFLPPVQIAVVNVKQWQKIGDNNELEANQIQLSSLVVLTHLENISSQRETDVIESIQTKNNNATIVRLNELDVDILSKLSPSDNNIEKMDHHKAHWASCSVDLPELFDENSIQELCNRIPKSILRVKGCAKLTKETVYTYFERTPDGNITTRPFNGVPPMGAKLLTIGLGSDEKLLNELIESL